MDKIKLTEEFLRSLRLISASDSSYTYISKTGEIVKLFTPLYLDIYKMIGIDLEAKLLNSAHYYISNEIIRPNAIIYGPGGQVYGYKTFRVIGKNLNEIDNQLTIKQKQDLSMYNAEHKKLEEIVKKNKDIVFPDLCTCENIIKTSGNRYKFIDYDGMQIGKYNAIQMSTTLDEDTYDYEVSKYSKDGLFTKNLDKKSLILLYFLSVFNVNINKVGMKNPITQEIITLESIFNELGITDYELFDKVKRIFDDSVDNVYLEDSIDRIAKDYKLLIVHQFFDGSCVKRLIKK